MRDNRNSSPHHRDRRVIDVLEVLSYASHGELAMNSSLANSVRGKRISIKNNKILTCDECDPPSPSLLEEGPSCIFVGPIKTASKETLEALYRQIGSPDPG
ncbi:hypothetical protein U1Q18_038906 [Sarracenia purpurea var. burkii]